MTKVQVKKDHAVPDPIFHRSPRLRWCSAWDRPGGRSTTAFSRARFATARGRTGSGRVRPMRTPTRSPNCARGNASYHGDERHDLYGDAGQRRARVCPATAPTRCAATAVPALWWNIAAFRTDGEVMPSKTGRSSFSSANISTAPDGSFLVRLSPDVQPGNWLPAEHGTRVALRLRSPKAASPPMAS